MKEGSFVKVVNSPGLPDTSIVGKLGRIVGSYKGDPIVNLKSRPSLLKGSCWCVPKSCLEESDDSKTGKIAWSEFFGCNILCTYYFSDDEWFFNLLDKEGDVRSKDWKANTSYRSFRWKEVS